MNEIKPSPLLFSAARLEGPGVEKSRRMLGDLAEIFEDREALEALPADTVAYEVASYMPVADGTPGGLFFGISYLHPVMVGDEYMMTKGHFHNRIDRAEFYWGLEGEGVLLMMDGERGCRAETVSPGSLHYIPGGVAHRLVNTGDVILAVGACWPSDAGHDYGSIARDGFSARVKKVDGKPALIIEVVSEPECEACEAARTGVYNDVNEDRSSERNAAFGFRDNFKGNGGDRH